MALAADWQEAQAALPDGWTEARVQLTLETAADSDRTLALLAPLQPLATASGISMRITRQGSGPSAEGLRRALGRLDGERLHGTLSVVSVEEREAEPVAEPELSLSESWDAALAGLPADWSDLLGEVELSSSDWVEPGALRLAPINPLRIGSTSRLQFRSASRFGYGASPGMVRRCLLRCEAAGMRGEVRVLRVLSDTRPVGTQGPVWQIDGRMV
jgi:hypothetical protein